VHADNRKHFTLHQIVQNQLISEELNIAIHCQPRISSLSIVFSLAYGGIWSYDPQFSTCVKKKLTNSVVLSSKNPNFLVAAL
jgi:hypothetical protein